LRKWLFLSVLTEVLAKLALYGSVLVLFVGAPGGAGVGSARTAGLIALVAAALGFARTWLRGELLSKQIESLYRVLAEAARRKSVPGLLANDDKQQPADLVHCACEVATVQALSVPDLIASFIGLALLLALTAARLGFLLLGLGLGSALLLVALLAPLRKLSRQAREAGWDALVGSTKLFGTLLGGSFELRGSGLDRAVEQRFLKQALDVARSERKSLLLGGVSGLLPAFLGAALLGLPREWVAPFLGARLGEVGVLAAAGVGLTLSATGALDAVTRNAPLRHDLGQFLGTRLGWFIEIEPAPARASLKAGRTIAALRFDQVSVRYDGAQISTPNALSFSLTKGGVALLGPNGAGKTSALLAALGLVELAAGSIELNGASVSASEWETFRKRCWVVPQRPHIVPDETIRFHMSGFGCETLADSDLERVLEPMGLLERLGRRAERAKVAIGELPFGALSGGEQRRILLAASWLRTADLVIFDEPEASIDESGRAELRDLFERMAKDRLVLIAVHDPSVVPDDFARVSVEALVVNRSV